MSNESIRVLLVEDDEDDYIFTRDLLTDMENKYQLDWAATFPAALQAIGRHEHDVYLVDYRLGTQDGLNLLREAMEQGCKAPVIMLTGQGDRALDLEALKVGAADYVVKGWNHGEILDRAIRYAIKQKRTEEELLQLQAELEDRVKSRTAELECVNRNLQAEIGERRKIEERLRASLQEKEVLLREIHHRVKNNLQLISSLLKLQAAQIHDPTILEVFQEAQERVKSMALIHEKLYRLKDLARIDFSDFVQSLAANLFHAYAMDSDAITLDVRVQQVLLSIDAVIPCALIIHELLANALKHAFPTGQGRIAIRASESPDQYLTLTVHDDGIGLPIDVDVHDTATLGLQLVEAMVAQLDGTIEIIREQGTTFCITFPEHNFQEHPGEEVGHVECTGSGSRG